LTNGDTNDTCCRQIGQSGCCKVESLVTVDERGQMVLPKEIRERADIHAGDKLAVIGWEKAGKLCCISLIKSDELSDMVKEMLGPLVKNIFTE
jgi:antitoxin PrlF